MKTRTPRRRPLAIACSQAHGFSLLEVLLALAAAAAIGTATFLVFRPSNTVAAVRVEQGNLRDLSQAVETSFGMVGTFSGVTTGRVRSDGLVPSAMLRSGSLRTSWGGAVEVAAAQVVQPDDAFAIAYPAVPSDACVGLAGAVADSVWDLRVGGHSVFTAGSLDPAALASRCSSDGAANMVFIYHSGLASGTAVAATPVSNPPPIVAPPAAPPSPPGTPWTPPSNPPVVVTPPVIVAPPPGTPVTVSPPVVGPPGTPVIVAPPGTPTAPPVAPPPYTATCQARTPADDTDTRTGASQAQTLDCPAAQWGQVNQTRSPSEARTRSWFCPDQYGNPSSEPWGNPVAGVWGPWVITGNGSWATTSSTCTNCPAPYMDTETRWDTRNIACPAGYTGAHTVEHAQARTRSVSTACPAGTRTLPAPTVTTWSGWADTGATRNDNNTCVAPPATCTGPLAPIDATDGVSVHFASVCLFNNDSGNYASSVCSPSYGWPAVWTPPASGNGLYHVEITGNNWMPAVFAKVVVTKDGDTQTLEMSIPAGSATAYNGTMNGTVTVGGKDLTVRLWCHYSPVSMSQPLARCSLFGPQKNTCP